MHLRSIVLGGLSAVGVLANLELEDRQLQVTNSEAASVLLVLATAIPQSLLSKATADPSAFAVDLESSIAAGDVPGWYQSLPADVKSYLPQLYPVSAAATTTPPATSSSTTAAAVTTLTPTSTEASSVSSTCACTGTAASGAPVGGNSTVVSTVSSATLSGSPIEATGGASYPTVVAGAGVAGALAFLGMLAM